MTAVDHATWRSDLARLDRTGFDAILVVQCSSDWLLSENIELRDDIDTAILDACATRPDLRVSRLILHNLPIVGIADGMLAELHRSLSDWTRRLAITTVVLSRPGQQRVQRLIVDGGASSPGVDDHFDVSYDGKWGRPEKTGAIMKLLTSKRGVTPVTGYDLGLDGPFGDADPSVYL